MAAMSQVNGSEQQVRWSQVEDTFFVGNHQGNFVGYIEQSPDGSYRTFDKTSTLRGEAPTLEESMACLDELYFATSHEGDRR